MLMFLSLALVAQTSAPKSQSDMHSLLLYGDGWMFKASEPVDWIADTDKIAREYQVNVIFIPKSKESRKHEVTIRVRLNEKTDEDPNADMKADVDGYKKQYPKTEFTPLAFNHPTMKTCAKLFAEPGKFYEYVSYLNPGKQYHTMFSVSMSKSKEAATPDEIAAFQHVLQSLIMLSDNIRVQKQP
jgi:hypothetical protein